MPIAVRADRRKNPQHEWPRDEATVLEHRGGRKLHQLLPDEVDATLLDQADETRLCLRIYFRSDHRLRHREAGYAAAERAGDRQLIEPLQDVAALAWLPAPPGRDIRQGQLGAHQVDPGGAGDQGLMFGF